jgi:hypothetical protein
LFRSDPGTGVAVSGMLKKANQFGIRHARKIPHRFLAAATKSTALTGYHLVPGFGAGLWDMDSHVWKDFGTFLQDSNTVRGVGKSIFTIEDFG